MVIRGTELELLRTVGTVLSAVPNLKLEWSIEIKKGVSTPRSKVLFLWRPQEVSEHSILELLEHLHCPTQLMKIRESIGSKLKLEGLRLDLVKDDGAPCLYWDFIDEKEEPRIEAYHWSFDKSIRQVDYSFRWFERKPVKISQFLEYLNTNNKAVVETVFKSFPLLAKSGYFVQYQKEVVKEVYLSFFWHPVLKDVISFLDPITQKALVPYGNLHFRYLAFNVCDLTEPVLTVYFSAPLRNHWPESFGQLQAEVTQSAQLLHKEIMLFGDLKN